MITSAFIHLYESDNILVVKEKNEEGKEYRVLRLGIDASIFMSPEKLEELKKVINE